MYSDTVTISKIAVPSQAVEAAQQISSSFAADTISSSLLGLALSNLNTRRPQQQLMWFDNTKTSFAAKLWTANLKKGVGRAIISGALTPRRILEPSLIHLPLLREDFANSPAYGTSSVPLPL